MLGESEPISGLAAACKEKQSKQGGEEQNGLAGRHGDGRHGDAPLLGPTPALLKSFGISSASSKTERFLHSLHPNRDLESLARDVDEIGDPA